MITLTAKIFLNNNKEILVNSNNLLSLESSIFDRSDLKLPSFGIISNAGNIKINDFDGSILQYAEEGLLEKGLNCEIYLNNTLKGVSTLIGVFETDEWDYDNENKVVNISIKDELEEWQNINVPKIIYDPRNGQAQNMSWYYNKLYSITKKNYNIAELSSLDSETIFVLKNTYTYYPLLEAGSLWVQWTKLCQVCQLHIYKDRNGTIITKYNRGN